jgi:NAD(P)H dehydrogenase (quinone)
MKTLIIVAHPNPTSFNKNGIVPEIENALKAKGHEVRVRDLYELNFNPVLGGADFAAMGQGTAQEDVLTERSHISWATNIIVVNPTWWIGRPAILQGYYDRVLGYNFAFTVDENGARGLLQTEKVLIINTAGTPENIYDMWPNSKQLLSRPQTEGLWNYCGVKQVEHVQFYGIASSTEADRNDMLQKVKEAVEAL